MSSLIEKLVHDTIEEYERLAAENKKLAEALRAEWAALNRPADQSVDPSADQSVDADSWIAWPGGGYPVDRCTVVAVRFRDGEIDHHSEAGAWSWRHANHPKDIVAYRIIKEEA